MLLIVIATVLVLGIAFFQSVQGTFSSLIMALLSICALVLAFTFYEPLAQSLLYTRQPGYADAVALVSIFVLSLLVLRILYDRFVGGNVLQSAWPDRIGGGLLGLISGLICAGVLTIAIQMMPWGSGILGYRPYNDALERDTSLWPLCPDDFTIGMTRMLSRGSLGTDPRKPFADTHDNLILELFCARNTGCDVRGAVLNGSTVAMPVGLTVSGAFLPPAGNDLPVWESDVPPNPAVICGGTTPTNTKVLVVRCVIAEEARAMDKDAVVRLAATQFRLVAQDEHGAFRSYYPVGYLTYLTPGQALTRGDKTAWMLHAAEVSGKDKEKTLVGKLSLMRQWTDTMKDKGLAVDWVFRIPVTDKPEEIFFRKVARSPVPAAREGMPPVADALARQQPQN